MALVDTYRNEVNRKQSDLASLQKKKSGIQSKLSAAQKKIADATKEQSRTKSQATWKSKQRTIDSAQADVVRFSKELANIEGKIASTTIALHASKGKLEKEEAKVATKQAKEEKAQQQETERSIARIQSDVRRQASHQSSLESRVKRLETPPDQITVLYLTAVPDGMNHIHTDREAREIRDAITRTLHRESIRFETRTAVRTIDLFQALNETKPTIVHFSGHGASTGELIFEDSQGSPKLVSPERIAAVLDTMADSVRLAVFNACFSESQAREVVACIEAAVGMGDAINDDTAIEFASQLYSAIGFGLSLEKSFEQAKAAIVLEGLPDADIPELFVSPGTAPSDIFYVSDES